FARRRKEGFRKFEVGGRLELVEEHLVLLVAEVLGHKLRGTGPTKHSEMIRRMHRRGLLKSVAFLSTNYDILIDNALLALWDGYSRRGRIGIDYAVDFRNFRRPVDWERPRPDSRVFLLKPHGSLNWLRCPTCNELEITPKEKGVVTRLISDFSHATCPECQSVYAPLIVPPTFYKDLNNVFLSSIWNKTDIALRKIRHIVFCGYSFPDADIHIK